MESNTNESFQMTGQENAENLQVIGKHKASETKGMFHSMWWLIYIALRSTAFLQASFNYGYFQGTGYSYVMYPFLKKIYAGNKERFKEALLDNIEFFNTGPMLMGPVMAIHLFMLESGSSDSDARSFKFAVMGPLAGINDSLFNFGTRPLFAGIAASLSADGSMSGFWLLFLGYNIFALAFSIALTVLAYRGGQKFMTNITSMMGNLIKVFSMVGITIIGALAISYTRVQLGLHSITAIISEGQVTIKDTSYQAIADKLVPLLLPALLVMFLYFAMTKKGWSLYRALIFVLLMGITGYVFGIFA